MSSDRMLCTVMYGLDMRGRGGRVRSQGVGPEQMDETKTRIGEEQRWSRRLQGRSRHPIVRPVERDMMCVTELAKGRALRLRGCVHCGPDVRLGRNVPRTNFRNMAKVDTNLTHYDACEHARLDSAT